jgi:hypothetical protein
VRHGQPTLAVIRDIALPSGARGDIIKFYNEAYIPVLKSYILQFQRAFDQQQAASKVMMMMMMMVMMMGAPRDKSRARARAD